MIPLDRKEDCCGCSACLAICPKSCITMEEDSEGFLYPSVNMQVCIHCDICNKTCPVINSIEVRKEKPEAFAAYCLEDDLRLSSSSGGIFSLLAEEILRRKGKVYGAAFDHDMMVHHIGITEVPELSKLRGSKYLQSRMERTYIEAKKALQEQKEVLFSGTACQIAGLKKYLQRDYENLITVDILCHGTPSPKLWKKYLNWQEKKAGSSIREVSFRNKEKGWRNYSFKITFENNREYKELFYLNSYMQLFLSDICLRPSCHTCKFKNINHPSDITLGDSWGIETYMPEMDDGKGTSLILVHSAKGRKLLELISGYMMIKEAEPDKILSPEADSRKSVKAHPRRAEFFRKLEQGSMEELRRMVLQPLRQRVWNALRKIKQKVKYNIVHLYKV